MIVSPVFSENRLTEIDRRGTDQPGPRGARNGANL